MADGVEEAADVVFIYFMRICPATFVKYLIFFYVLFIIFSFLMKMKNQSYRLTWYVFFLSFGESHILVITTEHISVFLRVHKDNIGSN